MIIDWCLAQSQHLDRSCTPEGLEHTRRLLAAAPLPLDLEAPSVHAVVISSLLDALISGGGTRCVVFGVLPVLERILDSKPAEYARLVSKGRLLFEHCMTESSHTCIIGFMHHELTKSRTAERVIVDLLGWMLEQRLAIAELVTDEGDEARARLAHCDYMLDHGVSFLHGIDQLAAQALAAAKEP